MMLGALAKLGTAGILQAGGTILGTFGAIQQGNAANAAAQYNAQQLEARGKAENAAAQREAEEQNRQKELMLSRARLVGAASGGGQDIALMGAIEEDGTMKSLNALWEGEEAEKGRKSQAAAERFDGAQAKKAGMLKGLSILGEGTASIYEKYL